MFSTLASWGLILILAFDAVILAIVIGGNLKHTPRRGPYTAPSNRDRSQPHSRAHPERRATPRYMGGRRKSDWIGSS